MMLSSFYLAVLRSCLCVRTNGNFIVILSISWRYHYIVFCNFQIFKKLYWQLHSIIADLLLCVIWICYYVKGADIPGQVRWLVDYISSFSEYVCMYENNTWFSSEIATVCMASVRCLMLQLCFTFWETSSLCPPDLTPPPSEILGMPSMVKGAQRGRGVCCHLCLICLFLFSRMQL